MPEEKNNPVLPSSPASQDVPEPSNHWKYTSETMQSSRMNGEGFPEASVQKRMDEPEITWTASEFVAHHKSVGWYGGLIAITAVLVLIGYFIIKDFVSILAIVVMSILIGVMANRKPRTLEYRLNTEGLWIGTIVHSYSKFKSFSVVKEGPLKSIVLLSLKPFLPPISIYYEPEDEERIVAMLSRRLPIEEHKNDAIDRIVKSVRF